MEEFFLFILLFTHKFFFHLIYFFGCWCFSFHSTERNKKRDIRNWYQSANDRYNDAIEDKPRDTLRRGDIPILHGDCDGKCWPQSTLFANAFIRSFIKFNFIGLVYLVARVKYAAQVFSDWNLLLFRYHVQSDSRSVGIGEIVARRSRTPNQRNQSFAAID